MMLNCQQCGAEFTKNPCAKIHKYCSTKCANRANNFRQALRASRGEYAERSYVTDAEYDHKRCLLADAKFCEAMILAGYEMNGMSKEPCTQNPKYMDHGINGGIRSNMGWADGPIAEGSHKCISFNVNFRDDTRKDSGR